MSGMSRDLAPRVLDDPLALRAFAHPLRLDLHLLLVREGTTTAADAARHLGISQALASHHLRQLAKYGFAEQVEGRDQRERPWRALSPSNTWRGADRSEAGASAADLLEQSLAERAFSELVEWQRRRRAPEQVPWREITGLGQSLLYLTPDEANELGTAIDEAIRPMLERALAGPDARPAGAVPVDLTYLMVPLTPTATGS
jgi:DNA-binding transcriptional ArsR family regulator